MTERKHILMTGASGLIGSALSTDLMAQGHAVTALRHYSQGSEPPPGSEAYWCPERDTYYLAGSTAFDAVVHLAGENAGDQRWSNEKRRLILHSRLTGARTLVRAVLALGHKPEVVMMASAIGYYGDTGDRVASEDSGPGSGFLSEICQQVEPLTKPLEDAGIRVVQMRFGVVLSPKGGALARMLTPFRLGLGGPVGTGRQWLSWVTLPELVAMIKFVINRPEIRGPINLVSPGAVTSREFTRALGKAVHRPAYLPLPEFIVRLAFGEMGEEMLLNSIRVCPQKLQTAGYDFLHPTLKDALIQVLKPHNNDENRSV